MNAKADPYTRTSFGRFLQKTRLEKGIPLTDVARQTRIRTQILLAIEKEEHDNLPAETFVKGLLKSFAKAVGADINEVLRLYGQNRQAVNKLTRFQTRPKKPVAGDWFKLVYGLGLLAVLAVVSIYVMMTVGGNMEPDAVIEEKRGREVSRPAAHLNGAADMDEDVSGKTNNPGGQDKEDGNLASATRTGKTSSENKTTPAAGNETSTVSSLETGGYLLSIHAVQDTWLKVIADGRKAVAYRLKKGDRLDLTAVSRFNILIGDADGVKLTLNNQPIPVNGNTGQIVNIEIP